MSDKNFYQMTADECFTSLNSSPNGLTSQRAEEIKKKIGSNVIPKAKASFYKRYIKPAFNLMIIILFICAIIQISLGEMLSGYLILIILILNVLIAMIQQFKAERTLKILEQLTAFKAKVIRDGKVIELSADDLVPGDVILLNQGDYIAADCRIFEANDLSMDESILTGETIPVEKNTAPIAESDVPIQNQTNMVFSSTFVASGTGKAIVVATGLNTEIGKITKGVAQKEYREIPLQKSMNRLAKGLGYLVLGVIAVLLVIAMIRGTDNPVGELSWLVSLAVAAIPFNFPIITTIILLTGVLHLARKQAIVRNLNAIETMGRLSIICSDKTGTLTENQMTVRYIYYDNKIYEMTGSGYFPEGTLYLDGKEVDVDSDPFLLGMFISGIINNNSQLSEQEVNIRKGTKKVRKVIGMPTEGALLVAAEKIGIDPDYERKHTDVIRELSFSSERKRMSKIIHRHNEIILFMKGAPEMVVERCSQQVLNAAIVPMDDQSRSLINKQIEQFASNGLRNLAFAFKRLDPNLTVERINAMDPDELESDLVFLGIMAMIDPPRPGVKESIQTCFNAGIKVSMITGDHPITARAIAQQLGLYHEGDLVISGSEIKNMSPEQIEKASVFARVAPEDKLIIVQALQSRNHIVGMTGDGVNDVLALENADVGIAMGLSGTDVAKNSADLILTDDSFTTIETALYHGRGLFNNIRSNIVFLLVSNLLELTLLTVIKLGFNIELFLQYQLLILYSTVHFFPPFGLMFDKYHEDLMNQPPKKPEEPIINKRYRLLMISQIVSMFIIIIVIWALLSNGILGLNEENLQEVYNIRHEPGYFNPPLPDGTDKSSLPDPNYVPLDFIKNLPNGTDILRSMKARTISFYILVFSEMWIAYEARSINLSMFKCRNNLALNILIVIVILIMVGIQYSKIALCYLVLMPMSISDWILAIGASFILILISELAKKTYLKKK